MTALADEATAAAHLGVKPRTLTRWRWARKGPKWIKVGSLIRYNPADLDAYIASVTVMP